MLIIHRMYRNKRDTALFCVLVDAPQGIVVVTKWVAADDRIERLKTFSFEKTTEVVSTNRLGISEDGAQKVTLACGVARYMADKARVQSVDQAIQELKADYPDMDLSDLSEELKVRRIADRQQVAKRVDVRAGDCVLCGVPVKYHFDDENRRVTCAAAADRKRQASQ